MAGISTQSLPLSSVDYFNAGRRFGARHCHVPAYSEIYSAVPPSARRAPQLRNVRQAPPLPQKRPPPVSPAAPTSPRHPPPVWDHNGRRVVGSVAPSAVAPRPARPAVSGHRLSPRLRNEHLLSINDFYSNCWLELRGTLPVYRTLTKARKAELAEAFRAIDDDQSGVVDLDELGLAMKALRFSPDEIREVAHLADGDKDGQILPSEFTRLCLEAERIAKNRLVFGSPGGTIERGRPDASSLGVAVGSHRIRRLVEAYITDSGSAEPLPPSKWKPTGPPRLD